MGLLSKGTSLSWEEIKAVSDKLREHGVQQFIYQYHKNKDRNNDEFLWGDEVEYTLVKFDDSEKTAKLLLKSEQILRYIQDTGADDSEYGVTWNIEYGSFMLEATPSKPYGKTIEDMSVVENNLRTRRKQIKHYLDLDEEILTVGIFPRLGCKKCTTIDYAVTPSKGVTKSWFFPDQIIFQDHPKMRDMTQKLQERIGHNPAINVPVFKDRKTWSAQGYIENGTPKDGAFMDHVFMDTTAFGLSCCALQVTMQAPNLQEAKYLYDQLATMCPVMLALSAATPIYRGYLTDIDGRWGVLEQAMDDRTDEERKSQHSEEQQRRRWSSIECYLSERYSEKSLKNFIYHKDIYKTMLESGVEEGLAKHFAYNFIKDPIYCVYKENLEPHSEEDTTHFDIFNSSTWQSLKLKLPLIHDNIGWRIEFRTMDVQMTDEENAALAIFVVLLSKAILAYRLEFVIPLTEVDENLELAYQRDAVRSNLFHFRDNVFTDESPDALQSSLQNNNIPKSDSNAYSKKTINEIINGYDHSIGLIHIIMFYLEEMKVEKNTKEIIQNYLSIVSKRASGELKTNATWIRDFVAEHPDYKQDCSY